MLHHRWKRAALLLPLVAVLLSALPYHAGVVQADHTPPPTSVTIAGNLQQELGCPADWQPECATTHLADRGNGVWRGEFSVPAGPWEYKAALNDAWNESYSGNHTLNGNTTLVVSPTTSVRFYYDHKTHAVLDSIGDEIVTVAGSFQSELGCAGDWLPQCVRTLMTDVDNNGIYSFKLTGVITGTYAFKVVEDEDWSNPAYPSSDFPVQISGPSQQITINWNKRTKEVTLGDSVGNLGLAKAHWLTRDTLAWNISPSEASAFSLHSDPTGALDLGPTGITGGTTISLSVLQGGLSQELRTKFPHLASYTALKIGSGDLAQVPSFLKGELAISARNGDGGLVDATSVQIPGVLDDLYTFNGTLGVSYSGTTPTLRLWAPTAKAVRLHVFDNATTAVSTTVNLTANLTNGTWSVVGQPAWTNKYYLYEVQVYSRSTDRVEINRVTDPYSFSLSMNSTRSQFVNLNDASLKPTGWDTVAKPALAAPEDIVLYELHVRDFSINDATVTAANRGTYKAFTESNANGMKHLKALAAAGLTHIHLLPVFDIASIEEDRTVRQEPDAALLSTFAPTSTQQQAEVDAKRDLDGFNWGYDPFHYTAPEGSYSTNPQGSTRIREFREMVQALNTNGLRVVVDVVYNHTSSSGQNDKSVLDRIVPGYYHRLSAIGGVETSTCCQNTATEHAMMEKLMVDSLVTWATAYKVDGFRFDLMGHHMKSNMIKVRDTLAALNVATHGVDGSKIYVYGEGWNFGEVASNARGENATQLNMPGTGIGTFSDRLRDAVRGGGPFSGLQEQGFINGLAYDPNGVTQGTILTQTDRLLLHADQIRIGLTGNLRDYSFQTRTGVITDGAHIDYNGQPAGYATDPQEVITYIEAHDNETLFDAIQLKAPSTATLDERIRMHNLGMSIVSLSQGVPFFQAGQDMLRSKSLDRNSYNSGDWFNKLDWSYVSNNWGVGLPPAENQGNWSIMAPLLANSALKPNQSQILKAVNHFREMLAIRKSSALFRLRTNADVKAVVSFLQTGPNQTPGLIVMRLADTGTTDLDPLYENIVVVFNATDEAQSITEPSLQGADLALHVVHKNSADPAVRAASFMKASGTISVPARTTVVFTNPINQLFFPLVRR